MLTEEQVNALWDEYFEKFGIPKTDEEWVQAVIKITFDSIARNRKQNNAWIRNVGRAV